MSELRPEVVSALVRGQWFDAATLRPTLEELGAAGDALCDLAKDELRQAGHLAPERSPLDLTMTQLRAYAAVYGIVEAATPPAVLATDPTVGARLKVLPPGFAVQVEDILVSAGLLPVDDAPGDV